MDPRPYHHGDLRHALVEAGLAILAEGGRAALTLRACAARVGVSHAAPRNHFSGLPGLLTAIGAEGFRRHAAAMRAEMPPGATREERLLGALKGYVTFATTEPALFKLMFALTRDDHKDPDLQAASQDSFAVLVEISEGLDWPGAGLVPGNANTWVMLWSFAHGLADLHLNGQVGKCEAAAGRPLDFFEIFPAFRYRD